MKSPELKTIVMPTDDWAIVCSSIGAFYVNAPDEDIGDAQKVLLSLTRQVLGDKRAKIMMSQLEELREEMQNE